MFKKLASVFLAASMVASVAAISASAAETEEAAVAADASSEIAADASSEVGAGTTIMFDCKSAGWENLAAKGVYAHIWRADGTGSWPGWKSKAEKCKYDASTGIATYDIATAQKKGYDMNIDNTKSYCVIFVVEAGAQTYNTIMSGKCFGDTLYCKDSTPVENPVDSEKTCLMAYWKNNTDCGPQKVINSSGKIVGNALAEGTSDVTLMADFMISYFDDAPKMEWVQGLFNELNISVADVYSSVLFKNDEAVKSGDKKQDDVDAMNASIKKTLEGIKDPTIKDGSSSKPNLDDVVAKDQSKPSNNSSSNGGSSNGGSSNGGSSNSGSSTGSGSTGSGSGSTGSNNVSTGQESTVLFVLAGLMACAAGVMFLARKKREI